MIIKKLKKYIEENELEGILLSSIIFLIVLIVINIIRILKGWN